MISTLLYIISLLWMFAGAAIMFAPDQAKKMTEKACSLDHKVMAAIAFAFSVVLLLGAGNTSFPMYAQVMAVLGAAKGLVYFFGGKEKIQAMLDWWMKTPDVAFRLLGLFSSGLGLILYKIIL